MACMERNTPDKRGDESSLCRENAVERADAYLRTVEPYPGHFRGRGLVTCAGGERYNTCAWVLIKTARALGCTLPIQVWYLGPEERDDRWVTLVEDLGVECVDAAAVSRRYPHRGLAGWPLKPYAILHSPFREVLFLDADNMPVADPTYLFDAPSYRRRGAIFWPDDRKTACHSQRWAVFGVEYRDEMELESGQMLIDKRACWPALKLCNWYNEHADFFYRIVYGDKDTFRFAWHRFELRYAMPRRGLARVPYTLCQHDLEGRRVFQHRCLEKWSLQGNRPAPGFQHERKCLQYLDELRRLWRPAAKAKGEK
jgi:hypothetical protein